MPWLAAATVAAPIVGGLVGNYMAKGDKAAQKAAMKQALAELEKIGYPPDTSKALVLKEFERQGVYTPEIEEDLNQTLQESQVAKITTDPTSKLAQLKALGIIGELGKTGLGPEDRAALNKVNREIQQSTEAKRQQILQQMQATGMGGSGASLMAQLGATQQAADLASQQSDQIMSQASSARRQALTEYGRLAGELRQQTFNEDAMRAQAIDERNRMLLENSIARQRANVGTLNQAQQANLQEQQRIADMNTQMANAEKQRQNEAQRSYFQDKLGLASAKSNALTGQANYYGQQAQNTAQSYSGMGSAIGGGIASYGQQKTQEDQFNKMYDLQKAKLGKG